MSDIVTVYATFPDAEEAAAISRTVVEEGLAACANILGPITSIYRWQGRLEDTQEVAALFKTRSDTAEALIGRLAALHSYDVPAAVVWPIAAGLPAYVKWVCSEVVG